VPPEVAFLSEDQWAEFTRMVGVALKSRGLRFDREGTTVVVTHPRQTTVGLTTLAQVCKGEPSDLWPQRIEEFLAAFDAVEDRSDVESLDEVRSMVKARLYPDDYAVGTPIELVARPFAESVLAVVTLDLPTAVQAVTTDVLERWQVDVDELFDLAFANAWADGPSEREEAHLGPDLTISVLVGDSFFTTTSVGRLDELIDVPAGGALVSIPNRHVILAHPVESVEVVRVVSPLIEMTRRFYDQGPGSLSQHVYWWRDRQLWWQPAVVGPGGIEFHPTDDFVQMLNRLGG